MTDWEFICPCSWKHKGTPERILELSNYEEHKDRIRVLTHDLISPFTDHTIESFGKVEYILNIASESHVDRSIINPGRFVTNNVAIVLNMLELSRVLKPKVFLQFSTDEVYGPSDHDGAHPEWSAIIPSNPYSGSKAAQEAIAISYWRTYGVPLVITNCMNIWGPRQDKEKYISQLISKIHNNEIVTIHGRRNDDGTANCGTRYYIDGESLADGVLFVLRNVVPIQYSHEDNILRPDRYNIVGDVQMDNYTLAKEIARLMQRPLRHEFVDFHLTRPGHDMHYGLDGTKLKELGWSCKNSFEDAMKQLIKWSLKNPSWM